MALYYRGMTHFLLPSLAVVSREARACDTCSESLPYKPKPIFRVGKTARLLIVGQAPGRLAHETGIPWNDPSGEVLRAWLGMDRDQFYDTSRIAIVPTGLCYPGTVDGADLPPCPQCAPLWQPRFRAALPEVRLTLLVGSYAHAFYLKERRKRTLADTVRAYREYLPEFFPLPHPSWRNLLWQRRNPWFAKSVVPALRRRVKACMSPV
jgi:uracil-DNA glycosylase